jgi:hypothetical protein
MDSNILLVYSYSQTLKKTQHALFNSIDKRGFIGAYIACTQHLDRRRYTLLAKIKKKE